MNKVEELALDHSTEQTVPAVSQVQRFRIEKLRKIVIAIASCFLLISIHLAYIGKYDTVAMLVTASLLIMGCYVIAKFHSMQAGTSSFMLLLSFACCYLMWVKEGLTDESILGLPCILIISTLIANFRLTFLLLVIFSINILTLAYVNEAGLYINDNNTSNISSGIQLTFVLVLLTFTVYMLSRDLYDLLKRLEAENLKVKASRREIIRLQNHDPLTGLPNRFLAEALFKERADLRHNTNSKTALMFIDLDNFKSINDTLGHAAGDDYLKNISARLVNLFGQSDSIFRLAGDEFVVISEHEDGRMDASAFAGKVLKALKEPIYVTGNQVSLSASIGIAMSPDDGTDFESLSQKADIAMYACKDSGRDRYQFFSQDMAVDNARQMKIAQELRGAIANDQLSALFQSKQALDSLQISGAEALLRWNHPELGAISPVEFIPIAERSGTIVELGSWVLEQSIKACRHWHDLGHDDISISVNVSSIQFSQDNFEDEVRDLLMKYRLGGQFLILELTESMFLETQTDMLSRIQMIRALGVRIAIDDFGTGYSNLAYLQKFDISILKIDRSFISKMLNSKQDLAIVEAIVTMSKSLNLISIAEGIENQSELEELIELGCNYGQGYYWSKPITGDDFVSLLARKSEAKL